MPPRARTLSRPRARPLSRAPLAAPLAALAAALAAGCSSGGGGEGAVASTRAETCMVCHNGSAHDDYAGPGLENPHPFGGAATIRCTGCHGGDPAAADPLRAHVPPPPEIGDEANQARDAHAYFNRLTLAGLDKLADYVVGGRTYAALDYLQFLNPGDLRVAGAGRGCGGCHDPHAQSTTKSLLYTEVGFFGGGRYAVGEETSVPESAGLYGDTAGDVAWRAASDPSFVGPLEPGSVPRYVEVPVHSVRGRRGGANIFEDRASYTAATLNAQVTADNRVLPDSPLSRLYHEQVAVTCGDCHLGSAGANNRYADFRSSGCTACHMRYSEDGRSRSTDPNIRKLEPLDPDDIDAPERPHVKRHLIASVAKTLPTGATLSGIDDTTCVGCHQGSNRTVLQYWGIRLDQNADLVRRTQYPANPVSFETTARDARLYDPAVGNRTFNGRNPNQYILREDYDGDGRDDTPPDVHYEAGMGCIDCHGSAELHGGRVGMPDNPLLSRMEQAVAIRCESCHGTISAYPATVSGTAFDGSGRRLVVDRKGNPVSNVFQDADGEYYLISKLDGRRHYVPQTRDVVADNGKAHPATARPIFNPKASYAMGRIDGDPSNGLGPVQVALPTTSGFSHTDDMSCVSCHASWTNTCVGCHLKGEYDLGNNFSNITGERIVYRQTNADFTYQSPVPFQLGVSAHDEVAPITNNTNVFYQYRDIDGQFTRVFAFSDRNGGGNAARPGSGPHPALGHNTLTPHSVRGRVSRDAEGPRYCVACHLTADGMARFGPEYAAFRDAMQSASYTALDFTLLEEHIGRNPGNQLDSPLWVHQVAGLGSGLFLFEARGAPVNPLDRSDRRPGTEVVVDGPDGQELRFGPPPRDVFDPATFIARVALNLDRIVEPNGVSNGSSNHQLLEPGAGPYLRDGALDPDFAGPLGARLIRRLTDPAAPDGIVLDAWFDADGAPRGGAAQVVTGAATAPP
jgi:hypothetical protein